MDRTARRLVHALRAFAGIALIVSGCLLFGSFYVTNDLGSAFCLGGSYIALIGSVLLFSYALYVSHLDEMSGASLDGNGEEDS